MDTLPDYLRSGLLFVSIGLNPTPVSVKAGYYFANPRNRFWKGLNGSRMLNTPLQPGVEAMQLLLDKYKIGFTDLVKRPTRTANMLRAADYQEGAPLLKSKLLEYQPLVAWFHGIVPYKSYLKYAEGIDSKVPWGAQKLQIGKTRVFVTPDPGPAKFSIDDLISYYNELVSYRIREQFGLGFG